MRTLCILLGSLWLLPLGSAYAQLDLPLASPAASIQTVIGKTNVVIDYHRPGVKGRKIWGGLVAFGEVWRLGANEATTIQLSTPVKVEGHDVPAGTYTLFAIPEPEQWTLVLNKNSKQWGAYRYQQEEDLLRFKVKPQTNPFTEWMLFTITPAERGKGTVEMAWENVRVAFTVEAEADTAAWARVDRVLGGTPKPSDYSLAAQFAVATGQRLDEALIWIDRSLALEDSVFGHDIKTRVLQRLNRTDEALTSVDLALAGAPDKYPRDLTWGLEQLKADLLKAKGRSSAEKNP
jgi:hypothetical protein